MPSSLRVSYLAHSIRSDWNNGNAHFLRGLLRAMKALGHSVSVIEPESEWSLDNLRNERLGPASLAQFNRVYPELPVSTYAPDEPRSAWRERLNDSHIVIFHEWNSPELAARLLDLRDELGFRLLFHDTHHRASSSPGQISAFEVERFDGVLAFGAALQHIYRQNFGIDRCWILHEAADTTVFHPISAEKQEDLVWIGNWGDGERSDEICQFLLRPASRMPDRRTTIYGVRYPEQGLQALRKAGVRYGGYLPNLEAPDIYARARLTVHIPRQQYSEAMTGIPTIRVFEALACGIPLLSAPWQDTEHLFRPGDLRFVHNASEMENAIRELLEDPAAARAQAQCGMETVLKHHTCRHRAEQLTTICQELLS